MFWEWSRDFYGQGMGPKLGCVFLSGKLPPPLSWDLHYVLEVLCCRPWALDEYLPWAPRADTILVTEPDHHSIRLHAHSGSGAQARAPCLTRPPSPQPPLVSLPHQM